GALGGKGEEEGDELVRRGGRRCAGPRVPARLRPGHGRRSLLRPMEAPPGCRRRDLGARRRPHRGGVRLPPGQGLPEARAVSCVRVHGGGAAPVWAEFGAVRRLPQHIFYPWTCPCDRNPVPWPRHAASFEVSSCFFGLIFPFHVL
ncbi:unnamed protein product, partial [Musa textilis]